mgnify:CR=1 FL=1
MPRASRRSTDRIADGGQREVVVDSAAEQRRQRHPLGVAGVLVLVEQHDPEALAATARRPGGTSTPAGRPKPSACRSPSPSRPACAAFSASIRRHQLGALGLGGQHPQQPLAGTAVALIWSGGQRVHQPLQLDVGVASAGRCRPGARPTDPPSRSTIAVTAAGVLSVFSAPGARVTTRNANCHNSVSLSSRVPGSDREQQAVLAQQCSGERVVGADRRRLVGVAISSPPGTMPAPASRASRVRPGAAAARRPCG